MVKDGISFVRLARVLAFKKDSARVRPLTIVFTFWLVSSLQRENLHSHLGMEIYFPELYLSVFTVQDGFYVRLAKFFF